MAGNSTSYTPPKTKMGVISTEKIRNNITGWLFITPATLLIFIFGIFPIGYAIYMSTHAWVIQPRYSYCLPNLQEEWNALPRGSERINQITKTWELDFTSEFVPNFDLGSCLANYSDIIGDYGGLLLFLGSIAFMFGIGWLWNRILREEGRKLHILKYTAAPILLIFAAVYLLPILEGIGTDNGITTLSIVFRLIVATIFGALAYWIWRQNFSTDTNFIIRMVIAFALLGISLFILSEGWNRMMSASGEQDFLEGMVYTVYYAIGSIPLQLGLGLLLAYILYRNIWGKEFWRIIFFLPYITPAVAAAVVFRIVFSPRETSLANQFITALGFEPLRWIQDPSPITEALFGLELQGFLQGPSVALVSVILLGIWTYVGYNAVIFLAGMGNIPNDLYEAARVDGANEWHLFRHITLPLLSPVTFYLSILGFIGTFKAFNTLFVMRDTQARGTTDTASIVVFLTFRQASDYGLATAQAVLLLLIILAITQFQRSVLEKRVFYG